MTDIIPKEASSLPNEDLPDSAIVCVETPTTQEIEPLINSDETPLEATESPTEKHVEDANTDDCLLSAEKQEPVEVSAPLAAESSNENEHSTTELTTKSSEHETEVMEDEEKQQEEEQNEKEQEESHRKLCIKRSREQEEVKDDEVVAETEKEEVPVETNEESPKKKARWSEDVPTHDIELASSE